MVTEVEASQKRSQAAAWERDQALQFYCNVGKDETRTQHFEDGEDIGFSNHDALFVIANLR